MRSKSTPSSSSAARAVAAEPEVGKCVEQHAPDQELEREVIHTLAAVAIGAARRLAPAVDDVVARGERQRDQPVVVACVRRLPRHAVAQLREHRPHGNASTSRGSGVSSTGS
jgi:hypothetical protein